MIRARDTPPKRANSALLPIVPPRSRSSNRNANANNRVIRGSRSLPDSSASLARSAGLTADVPALRPDPDRQGLSRDVARPV